MNRFLTLFTLPLALMASCKKEAEPVVQPPRPVIVQTVSEPRSEDLRSYSGVTKATGLSTLSFEQTGRLTQLIAKKGTTYKKGELIAVLDVANLDSDLMRSQAESRKSNEELKRVQQLYESGNASKADLDSAIANQRSQAAALQIAKNKVKQGELRMPYTGVIEDVLVDEQNVISAGASVVKIQGEGSMEIIINIPVAKVASIQPDMTTTVSIPAVTDKALTARVSKISPQASSNATFPITLVLDSHPDTLRGGMDAEVTFSFSNGTAALGIDNAAVIGAVGGLTYVWVITPTEGGLGKASKRAVTTGNIRSNGMIEILSGLKVGDLVITRGAHRMTEGQIATIQR